MDLTEATKLLKQKTNNLEIVKWGGGLCKLSLFKDIRYGYTFERRLHPLLRSKHQHLYVHTEEAVKGWLNIHVPHIKLVTHALKAKEPSTFFNTENDLTFQRKFSDIRTEFYRRPNRKVGLTSTDRRALKKKVWSEKYGVESPLQLPRVRQARIKKAHEDAKLIQGKIASQWAKDLGITETTVYKLNQEGLSHLLPDYKTGTFIETQVASFLDSLRISYIRNRKLEGTNNKPDFVIEDKKLIIECDGLYWHSEACEVKGARKKLRELYNSLGYKALFFRENEIHHKWPIVQSIIKHRLGLSNKLFARKCTIKQVDKTMAKHFLEDNHLMGPGSGEAFGLFNKEELCAIIQVKRTKLGHDVSRFCTKLDTSVAGAYDRLLKHSIRELDIKYLTTFVDRRYGSGDYLPRLGFQKETDFVSFVWVNNLKVLHRMKFPGKSGLDNGYLRHWDCGQTKYVWRQNALD